MTIKIIKIIASIIISVCGVMASFVIGQNFAGIDLRKADVLTKVKLLYFATPKCNKVQRKSVTP